MQNEGKNYWKKDESSDDSFNADQMYSPSPDVDEPLVTQVEANKKIEIDNAPVHWSANEYIHEEKNAIWFIIFALIAVAFVVADIFLIKSYTFSVLVVVMSISIIVYSKRPPRLIDYTLSGDQGIYIGDELHHFSEFKAFGLIKDGTHYSIMLIPTKRFSPGISVYFPDELGEKIVDILGMRLPMKPLKLDVIDILIRKLRL